MSVKDNFMKGIFKENPVFVFLLGLCPALAVTSSAESALGMGLLVILTLMASNVTISIVARFIPDEIRIPSYIVIIATFVTVIEMITNAFAPELAASLGVFIPLIVVNCLILGRAESFASKNNVFDSLIDGIGMGVGFTISLVLIGVVREVLATGAIAYGKVLPLPVSGEITVAPDALSMAFFGMPAGAFLTMGILLAIFANRTNKKEAKEKALAAQRSKEAAARAKAAKAAKEAEVKEATA
jgi:electron transport complex protein RnfE